MALARFQFVGRSKRPSLPQKIEKAVWARFGYACAKCGRPGVQVHHIVPWEESKYPSGNPHAFSNLVALCRPCHALADEGRLSRDELRILIEQRADGSRPYDAIWEWPNPGQSPREFAVLLDRLFMELFYKGRERQLLAFVEEELNGKHRARLLSAEEEVILLSQLGRIYRQSPIRKLRESEITLLKAYSLSDHLADNQLRLQLQSRLQYDIGYISFLRNDFEKARYHFEYSAALAACTENGTAKRISETLSTLAFARHHRIFLTDTIHENLCWFQDHEDSLAKQWTMDAKLHIGELLMWQNQPWEALEQFQLVLKDFEQHQIHVGRGTVFLRIGQAETILGSPKKAEDALSIAYGQYKQFRLTQRFAQICLAYGQALYSIDRVDEAVAVFQEGISAAPDMDNAEAIAGCHVALRQLLNLN